MDEEESEYGITSPNWMIKAVILGANPTLLKIAVCDMVDRAFDLEEGDSVQMDEIIDRMVQLAVQGRYYVPGDEEVEEDYFSDGEYSGELSEEQEKLAEKFRRIINGEDVEDDE